MSESSAPGARPVGGSSSRGSWRGAVGWLGGAVLGGVLLLAAALKALDPNAFAEEIARQGVGFGLPDRLVALAALAIEAGLGVLLLVDLRRRSVLVAATALVAFFLFLTGRGAWRESQGIVDDSGACGCFGALVERTPTEAFVQDLLLLVPALAAAWIGRPGARRHLVPRVTAAALAAGGTASFAFAAPGLPVDDWATRLRPGVELAQLCGGRDDERVCLSNLAPELATGTHLVVVADVKSEEFGALAQRLNGYARAGSQPPLSVLADFTADEKLALRFRFAPAFPLHETPQALLRPLYRRLPRSFRVEDGRVTATWAGLPETIPAEAGRDPRRGENR